MNCAQFQRAWIEQWDGEPGNPAGGVTAELANHLAACPACEMETRALTTLREALHADPEPSAPPDLAARALAQCLTQPAPRASTRGWLRWPMIPALTLAGAALACALVVLQIPQQPAGVRTVGPHEVKTTHPVQIDARDAQALATLGRAAERAERARMRAAAALGRAIRLGRLGTKEEL